MKLHGICIGTMTLALSCTIATAGGDRTLGSFDTDAVATCTFDNIHEAVLTRRLAKVRR